jgi:hypothetical protein
MFDRNPAHRHKDVLPVRIVLDGKEPFDGAVFVKVEERLSDLLNDPRPFLPVRREDGSILMVAKSQIASIIEREMTEAERAALNLAESGEDEETRRATEEAARAKAADDARRRAMELERLRAEIETKRAAARAAAEAASAAAAEAEAQFAAGSDEPDAEPQAAPNADAGGANGAAEDRAEQPQRPNRPRRAFDPYAMLRVRRGASVEEIKKAYKTRIKAVHPDVIASLDLDEDVVKAMHLTAQRINQAYDRIMRELARADERDADNPDTEKGAA